MSSSQNPVATCIDRLQRLYSPAMRDVWTACLGALHRVVAHNAFAYSLAPLGRAVYDGKMATRMEDAAAAAELFRTALDLYGTGEALMRQRIHRENPGLTPAEVEARLADWLQARPGAEHGDAAGRAVGWPRAQTP